ncbi:calcium-binding protein [Thermosynechococcaceae cyanobacterium BACA0444]|uniref:Calcium-binding protein n=1 Tax=Pseudocalidococcus azoricus BACA0444 TaxID=2918990 RepID=A0AAE4JY04_9CYAN|nr:calcium-binding protein [Pseudocalidococcus azoricus]MDS3860474.1 calcium-binding protein [Pseudocalidococcus azoricus BACA0444]
MTNNVENLILTGISDINGTGNALNNTIIGNAGINTLNGGMGDDYLDGGAGADNLVGGIGNDTYLVDNIGDLVTETSTITTEIDTVYASVTHTLTSNVENLFLTGTSALSGTGNALANTMTGNTGNNTLDGSFGADVLLGGDGSDLLIGGAGNDNLTGSNGNDFFRFNAPTEGIDTLTDFSKVSGNTDKIHILGSGFGGGLLLGTLASSRFILGTAATNTSQRFIYDQGTGSLFFDVDGLGGTAQAQIATLTSLPSLTASDIVVI